MSMNVENREAFLARLRPLLAPSELRMVESAYDKAKHLHRAQKRKELDSSGKPVRYFEHARAVALLLIDEVGCVESETICAALLHDTLEDTRYNQDAMEQDYGVVVARTVKRLSKCPKEGYVDRLVKYGEWRELLIKVCDIAHNVGTLRFGDKDFQVKQIREFEASYHKIPTRLLEVAPSQYLRGAQDLHNCIGCNLINIIRDLKNRGILD